MLLTRQKRAATSTQLHMAAMIDVVFLLLIFFMCTSSFLRPEQSVPSRLPEAGVGERPGELLDPVRIRLVRAASGVAITCDSQPCRGVGDLLAALTARRALGDPPVLIEGGPDVPFGEMVTALDACRRAGLYRTAFSAKGAQP